MMWLSGLTRRGRRSFIEQTALERFIASSSILPANQEGYVVSQQGSVCYWKLVFDPVKSKMVS